VADLPKQPKRAMERVCKENICLAGLLLAHQSSTALGKSWAWARAAEPTNQEAYPDGCAPV